MSAPVLTFFNNKGGVGKTSLVYHLSWMFAELGLTVVSLDLDAQANLTAAFLDEDQLERIWDFPETSAGETQANQPTTIYRAIAPLTQVGDLLSPQLHRASASLFQGIYLVPGDVALATFEETLSEAWPSSMGDTNLYRPFRILTAFWQVAQDAARQVDADIILVDVGPNLPDDAAPGIYQARRPESGAGRPCHFRTQPKTSPPFHGGQKAGSAK